jgi:hypothetical protein
MPTILAAKVRWQERGVNTRDKPEMYLHHWLSGVKANLVDGHAVYRSVFM